MCSFYSHLRIYKAADDYFHIFLVVHSLCLKNFMNLPKGVEDEISWKVLFRTGVKFASPHTIFKYCVD